MTLTCSAGLRPPFLVARFHSAWGGGGRRLSLGRARAEARGRLRLRSRLTLRVRVRARYRRRLRARPRVAGRGRVEVRGGLTSAIFWMLPVMKVVLPLISPDFCESRFCAPGGHEGEDVQVKARVRTRAW